MPYEIGFGFGNSTAPQIVKGHAAAGVGVAVQRVCRSGVMAAKFAAKTRRSSRFVGNREPYRGNG
jgi:hypothetical protein